MLLDGLYVAEDRWNESRRRVRRSHPDFLTINEHLAGLEEKARSVIHELVTEGRGVSADRLKERFVEMVETGGDARREFVDYMDELLNGYRKRGPISTYKAYRSVRNKFQDYLEQERGRSAPNLSAESLIVSFLTPLPTLRCRLHRMLRALRFSIPCLLGVLAAFPTWGQTAEPLSIESVQTVRVTGTSATFAISGRTPDPCWAKWYEVQVEDDQISVQLMGRDSGAICIQVVDFFVDTTTVNVPQPGTYTFSFWQSPSKELRRTLHLEPITGATLGANYPNPANARTVIPYEVNRAGEVRIAVYDALGREVHVLVDRFHKRGRYTVRLNASGWASGLYHYRLSTPEGPTITRSLTILK